MDVIVVGGGIAGASIAYELAAHREVLLIEADSTPGSQTTGRSAATWIDSYGPPAVRTLSEASLDWFLNPPIETDGDLARPMGCLWLGAEGYEQHLRDLTKTTGVSLIGAAEITELNPLLRPGLFDEAAYDERALDLDVAGLHHSYLRAFKARGGVVNTRSALLEATRINGIWRVRTANGDLSAPLLVNAAGAWGDHVATACGVQPVGLEPRRRSIFQSVPKEPVPHFPFTITVDETFYLKPEGDGVLCSPVDADLQEPGDPKPNDLEIARAIDAINDATTLNLRSVRTAWAGQRTFAPGGDPIARFDDTAEGFFWFVGQGGWGIQIAPAHAIAAAARIKSARLA